MDGRKIQGIPCSIALARGFITRIFYISYKRWPNRGVNSPYCALPPNHSCLKRPGRAEWPCARVSTPGAMSTKNAICLLSLFLAIPLSPVANYPVQAQKPATGQNLAIAGASTTLSGNGKLAYFANVPELLRVCSCESWGDPNKIPRQFLPDGQVLRGYPNPADVGACQIHVPVWGVTATKLGYNIYTLQGNINMAKYILKVQGLQAWEASKSCWAPEKSVLR